MSLLVVALPPRPRLHAGHGDAAASLPRPSEFAYAFSKDGLNLERHGRAAPALWPRADQVVAVLPAGEVSWHRIGCPRANGKKLRAALAGVLEEMLLDDTERLHFALAPGAKGGEPAWVMVTDREALGLGLAQIESAGVRVDRVVPAVWPDEPPSAHIDTAGDDLDATSIRLTWSDAEGVRVLPLQGSLARTLLPQPLPAELRISASPAAATAAERWIGRPVLVQTDAELALQAARSLWNLRQFDFTPRHRGLSALREARRRFFGASWRPVRWGLASLVVVQLVGLNVAAWQQRSTLADKRAEMGRLLTATHPQVRAVYDPAVQMQRETDLLRAAAGRGGDADLEAALQAAASAWPAGRPVQTLSFEAGRLTLAAPDWDEAQVAAFRDALALAGWQVEAVDGRLTLNRGAARPGADA